MPIIFNS